MTVSFLRKFSKKVYGPIKLNVSIFRNDVSLKLFIEAHADLISTQLDAERIQNNPSWNTNKSKKHVGMIWNRN